MVTALPGHRYQVREFIDTLLEAHIDPAAGRPTLGGLVDCLSDEVPAGLPRDEPLAVEPGLDLPHPTGQLRRRGGADLWARLPATGCYLHIPGRFAVGYKFDIFGAHVVLALRAAPQAPGLGLSENFAEVPVDRMIIDRAQITILVPDRYHHGDVEIRVS
jgi:hypothetical protein